jgi:hypothetical protein
MLKEISVVCIATFLFTQVAVTGFAESFHDISLPSGKVVRVTKAQLDRLISSSGINFVDTKNPYLPEGHVVIPLPSELGGGSLTGTPEAFAQAMNASNVTVGATGAYVTGTKVSTAAILAGVAVVGGIAALALSGGGTTTTAHH